MRFPIRSKRTGEGKIALSQRVVGDVVSARGVVGVEAGKRRLRGGWTPQLHGLTMEIVAAAFGDDVDHAARGGAVFGGKRIGQHVHLLHGGARNIVENGLAAPEIAGIGAIHFEPRLAAAGAVGGEQVLIHKHIAHVDGRTIGGVEQRQVGYALAQQRRLFDLLPG